MARKLQNGSSSKKVRGSPDHLTKYRRRPGSRTMIGNDDNSNSSYGGDDSVMVAMTEATKYVADEEPSSSTLGSSSSTAPSSKQSPKSHHPCLSWVVALFIGLISGASISSLSISSNQAATVMMLQKVSSSCTTFQDDKTGGGTDEPAAEYDDVRADPMKKSSLRLVSTSSKAVAREASSNTTKMISSSPSNKNKVIASGDMIAYGSQGPASSYLPLKERFEKVFQKGTYEFFFHAFDEDCSADGCIYKKGTSFAEGKNLIVKTIAKSPNYGRFKYINLFDDDAVLWNTHLHPEPPAATHVQVVEQGWETFHQLLLKDSTVHPLIKPRFWHRDHMDLTDTYQSCTDEQMWVFRRDHLHLFYPFMTLHKEFYWLGAIMAFRVMERCFPAGMQVLHEWATHNPAHRYKLPAAAKNLNWIRQAQRDYLSLKLPELSPWIIPPDEPMGYPDQRCTVKQLPSQSVNQECWAATESLFQRWVNDEIEPEDMIKTT